MTASPAQVDLAANLAALAKVLTNVLVPKMHDYAAGLITERSTPEKADDLAAVLEETARHVRACRPEPAQPNSEEESCSGNDSPSPGSRWRSAPDVTDLALRPTVSIVPPVEALDRSASASDDACPQCAGSGVIKWTQPVPDGSGGFSMREMEHFCPRGCGSEWKHPHAERKRVVDAPAGAPPVRIEGNAKAANQLPPELDRL
ncbi:hypothetical protein, partial [Actinokineospora sp.]|uniref:hypothetical protein n=1 Tax=Actinokineospora sp. TaxID=1872133 RepID=UPI003D6ADE93